MDDASPAPMASYLPEGIPIPMPAADGLDAPFWEGLRHHELCLQRCRTCGKFQVEPEWTCRQCSSFERSWTAVEPVGHILSWIRVWHPTHPSLQHACPYLVVCVELRHADGVRLTGNLLGDPMQKVDVGQPVLAVFEDHAGGYTLLQWTVQKS